QRRGFERSYGHRAGAENLKRVTEACSMIGVKYLTVYAFSTENWKRPTAEVSQLMQLFVEFFRKYDAELEANNIRLRFTGRIQELPQAVQDTINEAESGSFARTGMQLIIAFNYGGRQEIIDAAQRIAAAVEAGKISANEVDEALVTKHLYMPDVPDPDLIIRSSGEMRISNFLLWESAYAEFWVSDVLWPDFDRATLYKALYDFNGRERRFGGV
ncbi:MAG: di-trans,poly-cis-decaprenylcistransferase, partial [Clostridiaceae bacterium]|nr:di-trans,poly-cis-decaprenylcistransferase [Clostridiaceae bacterium]